MQSWAHRSASAIGPVSILIGSATNASKTVSVGSPIDSTSVMYSEANCEASRTPTVQYVHRQHARHTERERRLVVGCFTQLLQFREPLVGGSRT